MKWVKPRLVLFFGIITLVLVIAANLLKSHVPEAVFDGLTVVNILCALGAAVPSILVWSRIRKYPYGQARMLALGFIIGASDIFYFVSRFLGKFLGRL